MGLGGGSKPAWVQRTQVPLLAPVPGVVAAGTISPGRSTAVLASRPASRRMRNPLVAPGNDPKRVERGYFRFAEVGVQFAATVVVLILAGIWADGRFHTSPLFTIVGLFLGFGGATWNLVRTVLAPDRPSGSQDKKV
jgi:F0F1-type ATP synthase assembly protein I